MYLCVLAVFSKRLTLAHGNFGLLILCCTAATSPFLQLSNTVLFCFHCLWDTNTSCQLLGADWNGSSSAQQLLTPVRSVNPRSGKAKLSHEGLFIKDREHHFKVLHQALDSSLMASLGCTS